MTVPFTPACSILGHDATLDQSIRLPLLGVPLEIRSNSPAIIAAAERSFSGWRDLAPELIEQVALRRVDLVVHPGRQPETTRASFTFRSYRPYFLAASGDTLLVAQLDQGTALGFVTPELVADDLHFRYNVLECLALLLASWHDRAPLHAGAVIHKDLAIVLVGKSASGKSTLCYACLRAGFQLLAEDAVYVSLARGLRLWGNPWRIHLLPDARRYFPELADLPAQIQANGKLKLGIDVTNLGSDCLRTHAERAVVCLVQRHAGATSTLEPIDPGIVVDTLSQDLEPGFDLYSNHVAAASALADRGSYRLSVGSNLAGAAALLKSLAE
ncbi:MAG: hypothetical protein MI924_31995 [Chloroflexales bacterium]|nr:hypothetical protein [Chloroflexales bacterium]